jgi:hypothetical protein
MPVISHIWATASIGMHMTDSTLCQELKQPKLLDQVRLYLRLHHYSIHTGRSYVVDDEPESDPVRLWK